MFLSLIYNKQYLQPSWESCSCIKRETNQNSDLTGWVKKLNNLRENEKKIILIELMMIQSLKQIANYLTSIVNNNANIQKT